MKRSPSPTPLNPAKVRKVGEGFSNPEQTIYYKSWFYRNWEGPKELYYRGFNGSIFKEWDNYIKIKIENPNCTLVVLKYSYDQIIDSDDGVKKFYDEEAEGPIPMPMDMFYEFVMFKWSNNVALMYQYSFVIQCHNVDLNRALLNENIFKRLNVRIPEKHIRDIPFRMEKSEIFKISLTDTQLLKL